MENLMSSLGLWKKNCESWTRGIDVVSNASKLRVKNFFEGQIVRIPFYAAGQRHVEFES